MNVNVDATRLEGFIREMESHIPLLAEGLEACRRDPDDRLRMEEARDRLGTIRTAAQNLSIHSLSQVAEYPWSTLEGLLSGDLNWSDETAATLGAAAARLASCIGAIKTTAPARPVRIEDPEEPEWEVLDTVMADDDLWEAFTEETGEHFLKLEGALGQLERGANDDALKTLRRSVHQLKGASGVLGMRSTSSLNAAMQKLLDEILDGRGTYATDMLSLFRATIALVRESVENKGAGFGIRERVEEVLSVYREYQSRQPEPEPEPAVYHSEEPAAPRPAAAAPAPLDSSLADIPDSDPELWDAFTQESEEHLNLIAELLRKLDQDAPDAETLQAMRRSVHTLKGASGVVGLRLTSSVAHRMEDLLDALYEKRRDFTPEVAPLLFATFDLLTDAIGARGLSDDGRPRVREIYNRYLAALADAAPQTGPSMPDEEPEHEAEHEAVAAQAAKPAGEAGEAKPGAAKTSHFVRAPLEKVDELVRLVSELVIHRSRFEQHLSNYVHEVSELQLSVDRLNRISRRLQSDYEAAALQEANRRVAFAAVGGRGGSMAGDFDTLEFDRYTEFHLLSRELAETTGDVTNAGARLNDLVADFDGYLNRLGILTGDVEDRLMRLRMLPLKNLSTRLHRTVRVTAERRNKVVDFVIEGESVELDKTVLEEMAGPLDHILRNAVDHGVEPPAERKQAGKTDRGAITLRAAYEGTQIVLQIKDNGRGLDKNRLRDKAIRAGFGTETEVAGWSDAELYNLIFLPGFSTAKEISEVSGRGVGLDVVKEAVSKMKGTLSVTSERGNGTTFTIRLPMSMALTRVVLVKAANDTFAIPLTSIGQILRVEPEQMERVGRKPVLRLSGKIVPTMHLAEFVGQPLPSDLGLTKLKAVILNIGEQRMALMVDQVVEAREVVVKSLGNLLGRVHGVTGATLMGDGSVVLILNPNDMLHQHHVMAPQMRLRSMTPAAEPESDSMNVLIVDDSPSVRRVLTNLIRGAGWVPHAAKDGLDALEIIHASAMRPDVVILDVEMPRMDGYEFTASLRAMYQHRDTPIVMLTSRAGEKHRRRAFEVGATEYMVKPYQDDELLATLRRVVGAARARHASGSGEVIQ